MLLDFDSYCNKITDKIFLWFNMDSDPIYSKRFKKNIRWAGTKLIPFILNIVTFIILLTIFNRVVTNFIFLR